MSIYAIAKGPSKFDLMLSIFGGSAYSANPQPAVMFDIIVDGFPVRLGMRVNMVEREDDSGESWNIAGYADSWETHERLDPILKAKRKIRAYFRTDTRAGQFYLG